MNATEEEQELLACYSPGCQTIVFVAGSESRAGGCPAYGVIKHCAADMQVREIQKRGEQGRQTIIKTPLRGYCFAHLDGGLFMNPAGVSVSAPVSDLINAPFLRLMSTLTGGLEALTSGSE